MVLATVLVYLLQVALFRSWVGPFIIMFTVPLGLIGVVFMLYLTNTTLNVQSEMGAIFLVGIEVNTGVLIVEFANKQRKLGLSVQDAVVQGGHDSLPADHHDLPGVLHRPAADGDRHGRARQRGQRPLARAVVGGLLCSTMLSRFVLPVLYTLLVREGKVDDADIEAELADQPPTPARVISNEAIPYAQLVPASVRLGTGQAIDGPGAAAGKSKDGYHTPADEQE